MSSPAPGDQANGTSRVGMQHGAADAVPMNSGTGTGGSAETSRAPTPVSRPQSPRPSSPVPKVIGRGRGPRSTPGGSPAKQSSSPTNSVPDGNPPTGIVKGRRASLEGGIVAGVGRARAQELVPRGSGASTVALADDWEEDVDARTGKVFYVNHKIKKWSWTPPTLPTATKPKAAQPNSKPEPDTEDLARANSASTMPSYSVMSRTTSGQSSAGDAVSDTEFVPIGDNQAASSRLPMTAQGGIGEHAAEGKRGKVENKVENIVEDKQFLNKDRLVPPLIMPLAHTPIKRDDIKQATADAKWSRVEHDREVDELKNEIYLIRSKSKEHRRRSYVEPWSTGVLDPKGIGYSSPRSTTSSSKVKGSPLTHIDISKIRQVRQGVSFGSGSQGMQR
jgi:hypothetical protein